MLVSKREGLPRSIMEAMALGKPVVVSNVRGNRDLVEKGKNGILVELGDTDSLISAFKKLILDPELRNKMGKISSKKIRDYDLNIVLDRMASIYEFFIKNKKYKKRYS